MEATSAQLFWAVFGAILGLLLKPLWDFIASRRGEFSGQWRQVIGAFENEPEKIATVRVWQVGDRLYGTTERTQPRLEYLQKWKVEARIKRGLVFGIYWPQDAKRLPGSYGTLQFKIVHENMFEGFYVRAQASPGASTNEFRESLKTIPIYWERVPSGRRSR